MLAIISFYLYLFQARFFIYYTHWGMVLSCIYFCISTLCFKYAKLDLICCVLLLTAWNTEFLITTVFWAAFWAVVKDEEFVYVAIGIVAHGVILIFLLGDMMLCHCYFKRIWIIPSILIFLLYSVAFYLTYALTVGPVYKYVTYKNGLTYYVGILAFIALFVANELAFRFTKHRKEYLIGNV